MKRTFTKTLQSIVIALCLSFIVIPAQAGTLTNFSWSATSYEAGATATYTFEYTIETAAPELIIYAVPYYIAGSGYVIEWADLSQTTVTIDGVSAAIDLTPTYGWHGGGKLAIELEDPSLATSGAHIVITAVGTNSNTSGSYRWTFIRPADGGGRVYDDHPSINPLVITAAAPDAPTSSSPSSILADGFTANWQAVTGATGYKLQVSTSSTFDSFVTGYDGLDVENVNTYDVTGLNPVTTYYYRVVAYNEGGDSDASSYETVTTIKGTAVITTWPSATAITYGDALSVSSLSGGVADVTGTFTFTNESTTPSAGTMSQSVAFTPDDTDAYNVSYGSVSVTVNKKDITFEGYVLDDKVYDGTTDIDLTGLSGALVGVVDGDLVDIAHLTTGTLSQAAVGEDILVDAGFVVGTGDNYNFIDPALSINILPKELTIINAEAVNKVQDGTSVALVINAELSG